jgi:chromosomal replication initiator protein
MKTIIESIAEPSREFSGVLFNVELPGAQPEVRETRYGVFDPNKTFDSFVVGTHNSFAYASAQAVAEGPGESYNPLLLWGDPGVGKTHLLHAIAQQIIRSKQDAQVVYLTAEQLAPQLVNAGRCRAEDRFQGKWLQSDALLVDDLEFLVNKRALQDHFYHLFLMLQNSRIQIVLACSLPATESQGLEARLVSRFQWGLSADIQPSPA